MFLLFAGIAREWQSCPAGAEKHGAENMMYFDTVTFSFLLPDTNYYVRARRNNGNFNQYQFGNQQLCLGYPRNGLHPGYRPVSEHPHRIYSDKEVRARHRRSLRLSTDSWLSLTCSAYSCFRERWSNSSETISAAMNISLIMSRQRCSKGINRIFIF